MTNAVTYSVSEGIADIVLTRPPVNALDLATVREIIAALRRAAADTEVGAVVISSGTPRRFCAGLDLDQVQGKSVSEMHTLLSALYVELHDVQLALGKPSIAAVAGAARGAGMTLSISCDVIIAGEKATFGYPEIDVGLIPGIHFVHLPRIIGKHRAFELLFSGRSFGAVEAASLGLVSKIVPDADVLAEAHKLARTFAAKSPEVMRLARAAFGRACDMDYRRNVAEIVEAFCTIASTSDSQEGINAFAAKRPPVWKPR